MTFDYALLCPTLAFKGDSCITPRSSVFKLLASMCCWSFFFGLYRCLIFFSWAPYESNLLSALLMLKDPEENTVDIFE